MLKEYLPYLICVGIIILLHSYYYLRTRFLNAELQSEIEQKNRLLEKLQKMATQDELTGLPNRKLTLQMFRKEMMQSHRTGTKLAVLFIDLAGFSEINERHGHVQGDIILSQAAGILKSQVRGNDLVGRIGGDEFLLVLADIDSVDDARVVASKVIEQINNYAFENIPEKLAINIGMLVLVADETSSVESLLLLADSLQQQASENGPGTYKMQEIQD